MGEVGLIDQRGVLYVVHLAHYEPATIAMVNDGLFDIRVPVSYLEDARIVDGTPEIRTILEQAGAQVDTDSLRRLICEGRRPTTNESRYGFIEWENLTWLIDIASWVPASVVVTTQNIADGEHRMSLDQLSGAQLIPDSVISVHIGSNRVRQDLMANMLAEARR